MKIIFCILILLNALFGCRSAPFKVEALAVKEPKEIKAPDPQFVHDLAGVLSDGMAARYKKAGSPSFGLIKGYYKLPKTRPYGAATVVKSYSYNTYFEIAMPQGDSDHGYAIEPIGGDEATALDKALNSLLDIGVKMKEISMADALTIAKAESRVDNQQGGSKWGRILPPDVDYLMSIYPSSGPSGPVLIGRVIKKDGTLIAFRVVRYQQTTANSLGRLVISLFEDTVNRI